MKKTTQFISSISLSILFTLLFSVQAQQANAQSSAHESMIILKVTGADASHFESITSGVANQSDLTYEYSCSESGVIILNYRHSFSSKADVKSAVLNLVGTTAKTSQLEVIYVDIKPGNTSKC